VACPAHDDAVEPGHLWLFGYEVADVGDECHDLAVVADGWSGADVGLGFDLLVERQYDRRSTGF